MVNKTIPWKSKCKKTKWLSEEASQIAEKRREAKGKGERERYTQMNADFQRMARKEKLAFLNEQYKELEEINRMGKTRDLFRKLDMPREYFMQRWDNNGQKLLTEAEEIKERWQEYTELNEKVLITQITKMECYSPTARHPGM